MRLTLTVITVILLQTFSTAQITFNRAYGDKGYDYGYSLTQAADSGYAVVGNTSSWGNGNSDMYLIRLDTGGNFLWSKTYGGPFTDLAIDIIETASDSGFAILGHTNSYGNGGYDLFLVKTDKEGNELWNKTFGGEDWEFATSLIELNDGSLVLTGETYSYGNGNNDCYIVKTNSSGDSLWISTLGWKQHEVANHLMETHDNRLIITGETTTSPGKNTDILLAELDVNNGDTLWSKTFKHTSNTNGFRIIEATDRNWLIAGTSDSITAKKEQMYIHKINQFSLATVWESWYGTIENETCTGIVQSPITKNITISGTTESIDPNGDIIYYQLDSLGKWIQGSTRGGSNHEDSQRLILCKDNGTASVGSSETYGFGLSSVHVIKWDEDTNTPMETEEVQDITSIKENTPNTTITITPNPASNHLSISINSNTPINKTTVQIHDLTGKLIQQKELFSTNETISIATLPQGVYIAKIISEKESLTSFKLFICR